MSESVPELFWLPPVVPLSLLPGVVTEGVPDVVSPGVLLFPLVQATEQSRTVERASAERPHAAVLRIRWVAFIV